MRKEKPTGYRVRFTWIYDCDMTENGSMGTGKGEEIALSMQQLVKILKRINKRSRTDGRTVAEVIPMFGPLTSNAKGQP